MARFSNPTPQYLDSNGNPLSGGKLYSYDVGTLNAATTYSDEDLSTPNANPVVLDSAGRAGNVFFSGQLRFILKDSDDVQIWDRDYVGEGATSGQFSAWDSGTTYSSGDLVNYNGDYYISIANSNLNNIPASQPTKWSEVALIRQWNTNETYDDNEMVFNAGFQYVSESASNAGNDPTTDRTNWRPLMADAVGRITGDTTVVGYGIASVTTPAIGQRRVVFSRAAHSANGQSVFVTADGSVGSDGFAEIDIVNTTTVDILTYSGDPSSAVSWAITHIVRYFIPT
jgi:hypothetical protein